MKTYIKKGIFFVIMPILISGCSGKMAAAPLEEAGGMTKEQLVQESSLEEGSQEESRQEESRQEESSQEEREIPSAPPVLCLRDALSSAYNELEIMSGNYTWFCRTGNKDEMTGGIACGSGPLDEVKGRESLKLPRYSQMDSVIYTIFWEEMPDRMTVKEYSIADLGRMDAAPLSSMAYDEIFTIDLKPDRVYEITAEWEKESMDEKGYYGSASYVVATEWR